MTEGTLGVGVISVLCQCGQIWLLEGFCEGSQVFQGVNINTRLVCSEDETCGPPLHLIREDPPLTYHSTVKYKSEYTQEPHRRTQAERSSHIY